MKTERNMLLSKYCNSISSFMAFYVLGNSQIVFVESTKSMA